MLAPTKPKVLAEAEKLAKQKLPEEALEKLLLRASGGLSFFNTSRMDLSTLFLLHRLSKLRDPKDGDAHVGTRPAEPAKIA